MNTTIRYGNEGQHAEGTLVNVRSEIVKTNLETFVRFTAHWVEEDLPVVASLFVPGGPDSIAWCVQAGVIIPELLSKQEKK